MSESLTIKLISKLFKKIKIMENYGTLHNEMITAIMNNVKISADMTVEQKKEACIQGFITAYGEDNKEIFEQGITFSTPFEIVDSVKDRMSSELYTFLKEDIDYLLKNENVNYEEYFTKRFSEAKLDEKEFQLYKDCSSILISSVELWSSEEGTRYLDLLSTPDSDSVLRRPPTREQIIGTIGVHDWVGGFFGGLLGGPIGVAVGAAGASASAAISYSVGYH